jgi:ATP-dependent exoDNAse (exonuclease V) alpha subunit
LYDDSSIAVAGMTLDYVKVHLKDIFAEGQVYVALSRARSMNGLQVIENASRSYVNPHISHEIFISHYSFSVE